MEYLKNGKFFAQVAGSLEAHARQELEELGTQVIQEVPRGLRFSCDKATLYKVVYCSRLVQRVLAPLISFNCHSEKYLYKQALGGVDWTLLFSPQQSFGIESNVSESKISHSLYAGQLLKDAICDCFRAKFGVRPNFSSQGADINFNLHIRANWATISLDISGSMHKRGYRLSAGEAPLQETLAAAIIRLSGWKGEKPLLDPMCGSGTILAEALMHYCKIPAAYLRNDMGLSNMPDYDATLHKQIKHEANKQIIALPKGLIEGSDISAENIRIARDNLANLPSGKEIELRAKRFQDLPKKSGLCLITNPPYGIRLGSNSSTIVLYNELGNFLKQKCPNSEAFVLCGNKDLVPELRLRAHWKKGLKNGDLEVKLAKIIVKS